MDRNLLRKAAPIGLVCIFCLLSPAAQADFPHGAVVSDSAIASEAGLEILKAGGNAIDAACATALALGVVDPYASGLGGGGFALTYVASKRQVFALDFRERAPLKLSSAISSWPSQSALSIGVPGEVAGLFELHKNWGHLPFSKILKPAERLSRGFHVSDRLAKQLEDDQARFPASATALHRALFSQKGPFKPGARVSRPNLYKTLVRLRKEGPKAVYRGPIAHTIVRTVEGQGGWVNLEDLANYAPRHRIPLVTEFKGKKVYLMPPPSAGGVILAQSLSLVETPSTRWPKKAPGLWGDPSALHITAEALKHGFATRARWLGDPDFVKIPIDHLLSPQVLQDLAKNIHPDKVFDPDDYGVKKRAVESPAKDAGTAHVSVVDREGNAVALTTTINLEFGSRIVAGNTGILLNNELDDFTFADAKGDIFALAGSDHNRPAPGKRPLSSMSPTIVLDETGVFLVTGAAGGPRIISSTLQLLLDVLVFETAPDGAVAGPRIHHQWMPMNLEYEPALSPEVRAVLSRKGHKLIERKPIGKANLIVRGNHGWQVGAEPRSAGSASGH
jgi:gamma-glutamyltranspeptidase/glutathione hydrolase